MMKSILSVCLLSLSAASLNAAETNPLSQRVAADFTNRAEAAVWHYAVPPMSEHQRLPDAYPSDGQPDGVVRIVAAKGEYEPGSFLLWATRDLGKVRLELGDFKLVEGSKFKVERNKNSAVHLHLTPTPIFPNENLDLKVVKVWYQNRNGWFSYFGDTGFKLCPELLLNDEDLIRVDTAKKANYAKLVGKDGETKEQWINPPRQMDERQPRAPWSKIDTFHCMREDFHDAANLQPVALPKNEFRQFFLTTKVTPDMPAGLYRGQVKIKGVGVHRNAPSSSAPTPNACTYLTIPVELRVLDFELPQPKGYREPEKDFLVSSYSYISFDLIAERNGWNNELARRQLVAVLRNQVAHNQTMHWVRGGFNKETFDTIDCMREAGMRTDVLMGQGLVQVHYGRPMEEMREHARMVADELDRRYGHHNVFIGFGDEPGAKWLAMMRPAYEAYQSAGLKFVIAGRPIFSKAGYFYDWHNASHDAVDSTVTACWSKMDNDTHCAWYASQHVGSENPSFNRRQNGLGAYLAGYTALCNYAHHLGPYNDDSTGYKPMVLAYGSYDGVIDTLAWEGFREGIDDIRYATLMTDLARKAQKSKDVRVRYLGGKAMQFLAMTDPKGCDQNAVRGEMIRFIEELRPSVAPYSVKSEFSIDPVAAKASAVRAEASLRKDLDAEFAKLATARNKNETNKIHQAIAKVYARHGRVEDLSAWEKNVGLDRKPSVWDRIPNDLSLVKSEFDAAEFRYLKPTDTNGWTRAIGYVFRTLGHVAQTYVFQEKPAAFVAVWEHMLPIAEKWGVTVTSAAAKNAVWSYLQLGDAKGAAEAARVGLGDEKAKPAEKYYLGLARALAYTSGKPADFFAAAKKYDGATKGIPNKDRVEGLSNYGSALMNANRENAENAARGLNDFRKSLYKPEPKKRYAVGFSDVPIMGLTDLERAKAQRQACDRRFGGSMDFLETDVTTGERAVGHSKEKLADPTMEVVADVKGLHFLIRFADPKSKEVGMGLVPNCSFEGYIAPGANTPYACFMYTPQNRAASFFNTSYPALGGVRELEEDGKKVRFQSEYRDGEAVHYFFFAWENWMQRVPSEGTVWDFENICWHRAGNSCWNGTESIHGRSTWGGLEFHLSSAQRARIVKELLVTAARSYNAEKGYTAVTDGVLSRWQDPELGDPEFCAAEVKPLADELDGYAKLITVDMTDADVFRLEKDALPFWQDFRYEIDRRRAAWLLENNVSK